MRIKILEKLKKIIDTLSKYKLWGYTLLAIFLKNIFVLIVLVNGNILNTDLLNGFTSGLNLYLYVCFITAFLSFAFLFGKRAQMWFLIVFNFVISVLFLLDLWYYRAFGSFMSLHLLSQTANLENLQDSVISMARYIDFALFIDIIALVFVAIKKRSLNKETKRSILAFAVVFVFSALSIYLIHYKVDIIDKGIPRSVFKVCWTPNRTISNLSPLGYHYYDSVRYFEDLTPAKLTIDDKKEIEQWFAEKKENLPDNKYKAMFKGKNLLIIQLESMENFVINQKINNQEITPNLNKLIKNSLYFPDYYEQVYNGTSSDADLMTNTSLYPVREGSTFFRFADNTYVNTLPKLMRGIGYSTTAIHPDRGAFWNWMPALTSIGFQKCIDSHRFDEYEKVGLGISDECYFTQVEPIIKSMKQPFYTFMVTLTSHAPFDLPNKYRQLKLEDGMDDTRLGGYFQSVNYTDRQLGIFLDKLDKDGLLDNTVVVIYGDHQGIHKYYQDSINRMKDKEDWWVNNNKEVPLIIYSKGIQGEVIKTRGGQIDLLPTISYLMGVDENNYINTAIGRNLLKTNLDFAVMSNMEYVGSNLPYENIDLSKKGIAIANLIITTDYFKNKDKVK